ncbi:hypothetical protein JHK82_014388 [Glycine max]|nr:hypothetical protein JHK86_014416 [Glycine max]KAG5147507.1 hypothetical protein JHK82_014388 [Glycine max]
MLGDGGETPSRYELLSMVKKHSNLIGKTVVEEQDASDIEMDMRFWHDVFDLYFVCGKESRGRQDDDLVFFVRKLGSHGSGSNNKTESVDPYFVRRWAPKLSDLVDETSIDVDWRRSFYLNLIAHTSFSVTVAICSHQDLLNHRAGEDTPLSPIYKEVETTPAYPDICFAIDDFDSTFDAVVLTEKDHCYCVVLNAHDGAAFPSEKVSNDCSTSDSSSLQVHTISAKKKDTKHGQYKLKLFMLHSYESGHTLTEQLNSMEIRPCLKSMLVPNGLSYIGVTSSEMLSLTLFSGFVSYQMVRDAYDAGRSRFGSLLSVVHSSGKTDRIYMKGPGGRGEVEVAVSGVADQSHEDSGPFSPVISKKGFGLGVIVRKAASAASVAARHAYAAASASSPTFDELIPLKCSLMSISLPWEYIAYDLLFKLKWLTGRIFVLIATLRFYLFITHSGSTDYNNVIANLGSSSSEHVTIQCICGRNENRNRDFFEQLFPSYEIHFSSDMSCALACSEMCIFGVGLSNPG